MTDDEVWTRFADLARTWRIPGWEVSIRDAFEAVGVPLDDPDHARAAVRSALAGRPWLVVGWSDYCEDRRGSPAPLIDGTVVAFLDPAQHPSRLDVVEHADAASATADYVVREAFWVLASRRIQPGVDGA